MIYATNENPQIVFPIFHFVCFQISRVGQCITSPFKVSYQIPGKMRQSFESEPFYWMQGQISTIVGLQKSHKSRGGMEASMHSDSSPSRLRLQSQLPIPPTLAEQIGVCQRLYQRFSAFQNTELSNSLSPPAEPGGYQYNYHGKQPSDRKPESVYNVRIRTRCLGF